jgi:hypothetical protein
VTNVSASIGWRILVGTSLLAGACVAVILPAARAHRRRRHVIRRRHLGRRERLRARPGGGRGRGRRGHRTRADQRAPVYVGPDAWLTRDDGVRAMRRSGQAAAGRPMTLLADHAEAARGSRSPLASSSTGCRSRSPRAHSGRGSNRARPPRQILVGNVVKAYGPGRRSSGGRRGAPCSPSSRSRSSRTPSRRSRAGSPLRRCSASSPATCSASPSNASTASETLKSGGVGRPRAQIYEQRKDDLQGAGRIGDRLSRGLAVCPRAEPVRGAPSRLPGLFGLSGAAAANYPPHRRAASGTYSPGLRSDLLAVFRS